jgi:threonine synthase
VAKSTGNHGNSMAAYAAVTQLESAVVCNRDTPLLQLALMSGYGARIIRGGRQDEILLDMVREHSYFPCTILWPQAGISNPFGVEGFKTIAFEIVRQLGGKTPDRVFIPVGSGDGVYGIWKGFRELHERGLIAAAPRIVGCQPEGANSAAIAWRSGAQTVTALAEVETGALSVAELATGDHALRAIFESGGSMMEVSEAEILRARRDLLRHGFALELASALPYACASALQGEREGETWVLIGSGAAVKWPESFTNGFRTPTEASSETTTLSEWERTNVNALA